MFYTCFAFFSVLFLSHTLLAAEGGSRKLGAEKQRAEEFLGRAQMVWKNLAGYKVVTRRAYEGATVITTKYVSRRTPTAFVREERVTLRNDRLSRPQVTIQNAEGVWTVVNNAVVKLGSVAIYKEQFPHKLLEGPDIEYALEEITDSYGRKCMRVRASAGKEGGFKIDRSSIPPELRRITPAGVWKITTCVYLVEYSSGVIVSAQAIDSSGNVVTDVTYEEFKIEEKLDPDLFILPAGAVRDPKASNSATPSRGILR